MSGVNDCLPCPWCNSMELAIEELRFHESTTYNCNGKVRRHAEAEMVVACVNCGAHGPPGEWVVAHDDPDQPFAPMALRASESAVLAWNSRTPISEKAFQLVNAIMTEAYARIRQGSDRC